MNANHYLSNAAAFVVLLFVVASSDLTAAPKPKEYQEAIPAPSGEWQLVEVYRDGKKEKNLGEDLVTFRIANADFRMTVSGLDTISSPIRSYSVGKLRCIDFEAESHPLHRKAIFVVEEEVLTICEADPGTARPTIFETTRQSKTTIYRLKKIK